jgi:fused signal recognition particle receptor
LVFGLFKKKKNKEKSLETKIQDQNQPVQEQKTKDEKAPDQVPEQAPYHIPAHIPDHIPAHISDQETKEAETKASDLKDVKDTQEEASLPQSSKEQDLEDAVQQDAEESDAAPTEPEPAIPEQTAPEEKSSGGGLFARLKKGLTKTRQLFSTDVDELFTSGRPIDDNLFDELEELLITSDLGMDLTQKMMLRIRRKIGELKTVEQVKQVLKEELVLLFPKLETSEVQIKSKPHVIMLAGVNGTGKTTTLGKIAMKYSSQGKKVFVAAADTFRAAAIEQVEIWAERANAKLIKHKEGSDPAAVAFSCMEAALAKDADIVLVDTAGRLHTQKNLMEELKKIKRSINKKLADAPHEVLMVLDATTGQNAISQAELFHKEIELTGIVLTKLDGTAKGGVLPAIAHNMKLPIRYIGVGEQINDLQEFNPELFIKALVE